MAIMIFIVVAIHFHKASTVDNGRRMSRLMRMANWFILGLIYVIDIAVTNNFLGVSGEQLPPLFMRAIFRLSTLMVVFGEISYYGDTVWDIALSVGRRLQKLANGMALIWTRLIHR